MNIGLLTTSFPRHAGDYAGSFVGDRVQRLLSFVIVAQTALDGFIKSRRVDFTRFGDLVRFPLRAMGRRKAD